MPSAALPPSLPSRRLPVDGGSHEGAASGSPRPDPHTRAPGSPRTSAQRQEPTAILPRAPIPPGDAAAAGTVSLPPRSSPQASSPAPPSGPAWGALASRGMHLLQPHPALVRLGARHLAPPVLWLGEQMRTHSEWTLLAVHTLQDPSSATALAQRVAVAAGLFATGTAALSRQLQERDDPQAVARIAQALVDLDAARLAGELLGEAIQGLLQRLPDRDVAGLQLFVGIGAVMAHWHLKHRAPAPAPISPPEVPDTTAIPGTTTARGEPPRPRSAGLDRVVLANAVVVLHHAGQGMLGEGYARGVAESLSEGVRESVGQWLARARERR
ncbi:hypothetical protein AVHY2522_16125 [Acidovorax sp. SUPP2522]|uniref:hypothetical protein n=1 Tax=unclassified Acidovorax TaxID=2684926 RepID=UPI00234BAF2F|nr:MULTISPECIES: hypothetical protein [unclassified Acidovorax]WCM98687.1 hypothetical protein M5C96_04335 [Acidovorax sp. GBBC 1281]GKT17705.1 hypothetical protein AVHY2522_16125 [Acidovorax sp. SUPP2522]